MPPDRNAIFAGERVRYDQDGAHLTVDRIPGALPHRFIPSPLSAYSRLILGAHGFISGMTSPNALTFYGRYSDPKRLPELAFPAVRQALEDRAKDGDALAEWAQIEGTSLHAPWADEMAKDLARILADALERTREAAELVNAAAEHVRAWLAEKVDGAEESFSAHLLAAEIANWDRIPAVYGAATAADEDGLPLALADVLADDVWREEDREGIRQARLTPSADSDSPPFTAEGRVWAWLGAPDHLGAGSNGLLRVLAWRLWETRWKERVKRQLEAEERERKNAPGLPDPVYAAIGNTLVDAIHQNGRLVHKSSPSRQLPLIPAVDVHALDALPLGALGKLAAHQLVRWMIKAAHRGYYLTVDRPVQLVDGVTARRGATGVDLVVVGGLSRLAEVVGAGRSKKTPGHLRDALKVLSKVNLQWSAPGSEGGGSLVSWRGPGSGGEHPSPGQRSIVRITVSDVLCPGMAARLRGSSDALVVPVLDVPAMPDSVSARSHAALARFDWRVTRELVSHAREAIGHGGVFLNLHAIGKGAGLRPKHVDAAVELWTHDTDMAPARWELERHRVMLADRPPTAAARRWILDGAEMREGRAKGGRKSGRNRRRKLDGTPSRRK